MNRVRRYKQSQDHKTMRVKRSRGQAIIEYTCCMVVFLPILIGILHLTISAGMAFLFQGRLQAVATAAAQMHAGGHYWLGSVRADIDSNDEKQLARVTTAVNRMLATLNMPEATKVTANFTQDNNIGISEVTVTVPGIKLPFKGLQLAELKATGVSAEGCEPPYAAARLFIRTNNDTGETHRNIAILPCLGFGFQTNGADTKSSDFFAAGKLGTGKGGPSPTVKNPDSTIWVEDFEVDGSHSSPGASKATGGAMATTTDNLYFGK